MFRRFREAVSRPRPRPGTPVQDVGREVRTPDPYVWRLPTPYDARWRRWHKRSRAAGQYLPFPQDETYWHPPDTDRPPPRPAADDDVVRPYILRP